MSKMQSSKAGLKKPERAVPNPFTSATTCAAALPGFRLRFQHCGHTAPLWHVAKARDFDNTTVFLLFRPIQN
jgi:hypothetical protein